MYLPAKAYLRTRNLDNFLLLKYSQQEEEVAN